jgi:hypothetical protein
VPRQWLLPNGGSPLLVRRPSCGPSSCWRAPPSFEPSPSCAASRRIAKGFRSAFAHRWATSGSRFFLGSRAAYTARMSKQSPEPAGIFVSMFVTNRVIEKVGKNVTLFDLEGAGYGCWIVDEPGMSMQLMGDVFVMVSMVRTGAGKHRLRFEVELEGGERLHVAEEPLVSAGRNHVMQFNVSLSKMILPVGIHHLWAFVNGEAKACAPIWIYEPESE